MAYDQGNYAPPQRPYNGRAAQRPGPPQGYNQPPPQQQQQYDQYPQSGYGNNEYDNGHANGYAQDYNDGYQDANGGGRGNGYSQQNQNHPPPQQQQQQEYYPEPRGGGMPPRGGRGGPPPQQQRGPPMDDRMRGGYDQRGGPQNGRGGPPPRQRPPMDDGVYDQRGGDARGGFDQRGGRPGPGPAPQRGPPMNDGGRGGSGGFDQRGGQGGSQNAGPGGRGGGRPPPQDRPDPGQQGQQPQQVRRPLKTPPMSPDQQTWDNPFPTFPGAKKKTSVDEEQTILQKMEGMNMNNAPQGRPGTAGSKHSQRSQQAGFTAPGRAATFDDYGRPSEERQRAPQNAYSQEPVQNFSAPQQRPPPQAVGNSSARNNAYWDPNFDQGESFAPPSRSNTMPNEQPPPIGNQQPFPRTMDGVGPSAPYNGPVGRNLPPRPSTATGSRPPPQRTYPAPIPIAPQQNYINRYEEPLQHNRSNESISDLYDSYYDDPDPRRSQARYSGQNDMPDYGANPSNQGSHRRGASRDAHIETGPVQQQGGYQKPVQNQADHRALMQPQAAVFDSASDGQRTPTNGYFQQNQGQNQNQSSNQYQSQYDEYDLTNGQYNQQNSNGGHNQDNGGYNQNQNQRPPMQGGYTDPAPKNSFQPPPRSTSAAPRMGQGYNGPPPPNVGPKPGMNGMNGLPNGPKNGTPGMNGQPNGLQNVMPRNNSAGSANNAPRSKLGEDNSASHPIPVRAGLIPGSVAAQNANTKPAPVRHYNGNPNAATVQTAPAPQVAPTGPQPVTISELEMIKSAAKAKPNDIPIQLHLIKKLVEASEVLVTPGVFPDIRMRTKMRDKYVMDAAKMLKRLVASGNTDAMFFLADCYGRGILGSENNDKEAFTLYQTAAKAGNAAAAYRTAVCCELGNEEGGGTRKDPVKAIQWYKRAATLGDTPAMYKMGMIQLKGLLGQPPNPREAVESLKRAAECADAENPHALHELGLLFEAPQSADGSIVRDEVYSFSLFKQAAELGYKFSQFKMGCAYEYGLLGCPIDARQSIAWYSRAAVQEEHQAELALSGWYLTGSEGVLQQSDTEAYLWARKAAMAGNAKAEYAMGYFTEVGIGSPSSLEDAKRWYWKAAAQNFPQARERLEDLKKNGGKGGAKSRDRISRSKMGKQNEGECAVM